MLIDHIAYSNRLRFIPPAEKAGLSLCCILAVQFSRTTLVPWLVILLTCLIALGFARIKAAEWCRLSLLPVGFLLAAGLGLALEVGSVEGPGFISISQGLALGFTEAGFREAGRVSLSAFASMSSMLLLAATTPMTDVVALFRRLKVPCLLTEMASLTYRSLFILLDTAARMRQAQASRLGYSGFWNSFRSLSLLASVLFYRVIERSDLSWRVLLARGYEDGLRVLEPEYSRSAIRMTCTACLSIGLLVLSLVLSGENG